MKSTMSFTEKRISVNAIVAFVIGVLLNLVHVSMVVLSAVKQGNVSFFGGVVESYVFLFGIFGLLWGVMSLDDEKTNGKYKKSGILLNGISLVLSIGVMVLGVMTY